MASAGEGQQPQAGPGARSAAPLSGGAEELHRLEQAGALVMAARLALKRGQRGEARAKLQQALAINPNDCGALETIGDMYLEEGEQEKAIRVFEHGLKFHPKHAPFEEKLGEAHLDLDEMRRDQELREQILAGEAEAPQVQFKPARAAGLSIVVPGAGHFYIEDDERGTAFVVAWIATLLGWGIPFQIAWQSLGGVTGKGAHSIGAAISRLNGFWQLWFYLMVLAWIAVYVGAVFDSIQGIERAKTAKRNELGI